MGVKGKREVKYVHYKIAIGEKTGDSKNRIRDIKSKFLIEGLDLIDLGNDTYDYRNMEYLYSLCITIVDRENTFLNTYIQDTLRYLNITKFSGKLISEKEFAEMKNRRYR